MKWVQMEILFKTKHPNFECNVKDDYNDDESLEMYSQNNFYLNKW